MIEWIGRELPKVSAIKIYSDMNDIMRLGQPTEYADDAELRDLIECNPEVLQIERSERLTCLGLAIGSAGLVAVEPSGRPVIIQARLRKNYQRVQRPVSAVFRNAAFLRGYDLRTFEDDKLAGGSVFERVSSNPRSGLCLDKGAFESNLQRHLRRGDFRLVIAMDGASDALGEIVAHARSFLTDEVTLDLVTIPLREIEGYKVAFPMRSRFAAGNGG